MEDVQDINFILNKYNVPPEAVQLICQLMRIEFFDEFRQLMLEKDGEHDQIALEVLDWAYQRLANVKDLL
jgi:hypothetical protein